MNTTNIGNIGYAKVLSKFVELGIPIYVPFGEGYTADLIAQFGGKLNKIQIKTTQKIHNGECIKWKITKQEGYHGNQKSYTEDEVDYFALYCIEADVLCLVPFDRAPKAEMIIRLDSYTGTKTKIMKFVSDFLFEKVIS